MLCKWQNMSEQLQEEPKLDPNCSGEHKQKVVAEVVFEIKSLRHVSGLDHSYFLGCKTRSKLDRQLTIILFVLWADLFYMHKIHSTGRRYVKAS